MSDINKAREALKGKAGVISVGYGYKKKAGVLTGIPSFIVYVKEKLPMSALSAADIVPASIEGTITDVQEIRTVDALSYTERKRPVPGGWSIGHQLTTAGSSGLPVVERDGVKCLLSNYHVLSPEYIGEVKVGDPIISPGRVDGGTIGDTIATLHHWIPLDPDENQVDCALARIIEGQVAWMIYGIPRVYERVGNPMLGQICVKVGRTTELTKGRITTIGALVYVRYTDTLVPLFKEQLEITSLDDKPYLLGGDSGSCTVSEDGVEALGLNFAGGGGVGYANPMALVQQALGFTIVPKPAPPEKETVEKQLAGLKGILIAAWGYDARAEKYSAYPSQSGYSELKVLEAGKGYWLYLSQDTTFIRNRFAYVLYKGWNLFGFLG